MSKARGSTVEEGGEDGGAAGMDEFMDTPLARLCVIPMNQIERNEIDELNLNGKGMTDFEVMVLGDLLAGNNSLKRLDLRNNPKITKDGAIQNLLEPLRKHPRMQNFCEIPLRGLKTLRALDVKNSDLGDLEASLLAELCRGSKLRELNLKGNNFSPGSCQELLKILDTCPTLESICDIPVQDVLKNRITNMKLSHRALGDFEALLLSELLRMNKSLRNVAAEGNKFESVQAAKALASALLGHPVMEIFSGIPVQELKYGLEELDMSQSTMIESNGKFNPLGDFGCVLVAELIRGGGAAKYLRNLNLAENEIGIAGFRFLAQALGSCPKLERLDLQGNAPMARDVLLEILSALDAAPKGVKVNLFGYSIRGEEFITLRRVIGGGLAGFDIGPREVEVIEAALKYIDFITDLDLKGTTMGRTEALKVLRAVEGGCQQKMVVNIWGYPIRKCDARAVVDLLEKEEGESCPIFKIAATLGTVHGVSSRAASLAGSRRPSMSSQTGSQISEEYRA